MGKYIMIVQSRAKQGRDDDYNQWYDTIHREDLLAIPGIEACRRYEATPIAMGTPGLPYLSIFEVETDDPGAVLAELGSRAQDGRMRQTDALDPENTALWFYKLRDTPAA